MVIEPTVESVLMAQRADTLSKLANSAQASAQENARRVAGGISEQAQNAKDINTATLPTDPNRGRNLNVSA